MESPRPGPGHIIYENVINGSIDCAGDDAEQNGGLVRISGGRRAPKIEVLQEEFKTVVRISVKDSPDPDPGTGYPAYENGYLNGSNGFVFVNAGRVYENVERGGTGNGVKAAQTETSPEKGKEYGDPFDSGASSDVDSLPNFGKRGNVMITIKNLQEMRSEEPGHKRAESLTSSGLGADTDDEEEDDGKSNISCDSLNSAEQCQDHGYHTPNLDASGSPVEALYEGLRGPKGDTAPRATFAAERVKTLREDFVRDLIEPRGLGEYEEVGYEGGRPQFRVSGEKEQGQSEQAEWENRQQQCQQQSKRQHQELILQEPHQTTGNCQQRYREQQDCEPIQQPQSSVNHGHPFQKLHHREDRGPGNEGTRCQKRSQFYQQQHNQQEKEPNQRLERETEQQQGNRREPLEEPTGNPENPGEKLPNSQPKRHQQQQQETSGNRPKQGRQFNERGGEGDENPLPAGLLRDIRSLRVSSKFPNGAHREGAKEPVARAVLELEKPEPPSLPAVVVVERTYGERSDGICAMEVDTDQFYRFHLRENGRRGEEEGDEGQEETFAGVKDFLSSERPAAITSAKGTIRGVKNRVKAGIATFLQMHENKPYKDRDAGKVVVYTTTMGIVRDTYQKCLKVKQILRTLLVKFEERDVFMSAEAQDEIKERMKCDVILVPQVFVEGQHVGDAETIERLNEMGELRTILRPYKSPDACSTCKVCGGYRLLPCSVCKGSKKSIHRNNFTQGLVSLKCMNCDQVGLTRCHAC